MKNRKVGGQGGEKDLEGVGGEESILSKYIEFSKKSKNIKNYRNLKEN